MTAPTKPGSPSLLTGINALMASQPPSPALRGGVEFSYDGSTAGLPLASGTSPAPSADPASNPFAGMGPLLEDDDAKVFQTIEALIKRQEPIAQNHLAQDTYYTLCKLGYPLAAGLNKNAGKDTYSIEYYYGTKSLSIQAVPNKTWDLVTKTAEALLVDFPEVEAQPWDDSEEASAACEIANRFLSQDATEQGTNDAVLYHDRLVKGLTCASSYIEYWVDPSGGGYIPLQIKAHPQAVSPANPLVDPAGMPTTDYVLRYVTAEGAPGPDGQPTPAQFTDDPSAAAPQWQPKIKASCWNREHIRTFPETHPVETAEKVAILGYCSLSEGRKRWPSIAALSPDELTQLTDWTPDRYLPLLPPFQRSRWKLSDGREKEKAGSSDERNMFYYHVYVRACPDYKKGADVVVTGARNKFVIDRKLLAKDVEVDRSHATGPKKETRCLEIPVVQLTPFGDPDEADPSGRSFIERFSGAAENNAFLAMSFADIVNQNLHLEGYINATSPVEGAQRDEARASGTLIPIKKPGDLPIWGTPVPLSPVFFSMYNLSDEAINSIASTERAAQGADTSKERSGRALQIAVSQNSIGRTSPLNATMNAYARGCRIKIELAMANFSTAQQLSYVGDDGAYTQDEWTGIDFALVGKVAIKAGTGTMLPADQKVQYLANVVQSGMLSKEEGASAARATFAKRLGIPADPQEQYVKRCIESWLKGPPAPTPAAPVDPTQPTQPPPPTWEQQYQAWHQAQDAFAQATQAYTQQKQLYDAAVQNTAIAAGGPPPAKLGPESQNESAMLHYQMAVEALQTNPLPPTPPVAPQQPQVPKPWTPFTPRPNDTEPAIAAMWRRLLSDAMSTVKYGEFGPEWQDVLIRQYSMARQAESVGQTAQAQHGITPVVHPPKPHQLPRSA